jgi:hypothetical protein
VLAVRGAVGAGPAAQVVAGLRRDVGLADAGAQAGGVGRRGRQQGHEGRDQGECAAHPRHFATIRRVLRRMLPLLVCLLTAPASAFAAVPASCPGDPIAPTRVITGQFPAEIQGSNVLVPFDVPAGTTAVRVKYCHDQPEAPTSSQIRHTLDLGLYDQGGEGFRGWGGSSHPDVTVSPEGFSTQQQYEERPRGHVPGRTTRGFLPGPIEPGRWAVELGVAAVADQTEGDLTGEVAWRIEIELSSDPAFADEPYEPARYSRAPAVDEPGWYAGDLHVHAEHSALGDATMTEAFDFAFREAGLDFVTLSDYVSGSSWGEIGRHQGNYPGKLIVRSAEVITYRGHLNSHANTTHVDYRTGRLFSLRPDGSLEVVRAAGSTRERFEGIHAAGGFTQVNHPTIFPSEVPVFAGLCRGCPWDYSDEETAWQEVDAYEVHTGPAGAPQPQGAEPGPNPFTLTAIDEYDRLRRAGHWLAAVAVSDSHNAGRSENAVTQSPIGEGTTVVYADQLSERGVRRGVQAGHTYTKLFGAASPDLRLEAEGGGARAIMGDGLLAEQAEFTAQVIGGVPAARTLVVLRDGEPIDTVPVTSADFTHRFTGNGRGDYRIQVLRGSAIDGLTTPIRLGALHPPPRAEAVGGDRPRMRVSVRPRRTRAGRRTRFRVRVRSSGEAVRGARVRLGGRSARTNVRGRAVIAKRFNRAGVRRVRATRSGYASASARVRVTRRSGPAPVFAG